VASITASDDGNPTRIVVLTQKGLFCDRGKQMRISISGGRSVGIVRSRTKGHGVCLFCLIQFRQMNFYGLFIGFHKANCM
jgi:hypothetical protein